MKKYFPILLSKSGELKALSMINTGIRKEITPILQVLDSQLDNIQQAFVSEDGFYDEIFLDFSLVKNPRRVEIKDLIMTLIRQEIEVIPVVQVNSNSIYLKVINDLLSEEYINEICIRFSNDSGGFLDTGRILDSLSNELNLDKESVSILFDFGYVESHNKNIIPTLAVKIINELEESVNYKNIIVASGSFPVNLSSYRANEVHLLPRYEWDIWNNILPNCNNLNNLKYADYGTKYPIYNEANFLGSCSIKYSTQSNYVIYRGELAGNHKLGNGQYIMYAAQLINSAYYSGREFSWGDERVYFYGTQNLDDPKKKSGNAKTWVEISQNHHITLIHSLL